MSLRLVTKPGNELYAMLEVLTKAGGVPVHERDNVETVQKFKYMCGRNYKLLHSRLEEIEREAEKGRVPHEDWETYCRKYQHLGEEYCKRDESGQPVIDSRDPDNPRYEFGSKEEETEYKAAVDALRVEYADALAHMANQNDLIEKLWANDYTVGLYTVPFSWVPLRLHGGFIDSLICVLTDVPEDLPPANNPAGGICEADDQATMGG